MESYGLSLKSDLIIEKVRVRLPWTKTDEGRVIYDMSTKRSYIGTSTGWKLLGIYERMIHEPHLFLDTQITGSKQTISALRIPIQLNVYEQLLLNANNFYSVGEEFFSYDSTSNIQFMLDSIQYHISSTITPFDNKSIDNHSFNNSVTSNSIPFDIINTISTINDELNLIQLIESNNVYLADLDINDPDFNFGYLLGFAKISVFKALCDISNFLIDLSADDILANASYISKLSNIQFILDDVHRLNSIVRFIELWDVPKNYDPDPLVAIMTNGQDELIWNKPASKNINIKFPDIFNDVSNDLNDDIILTVNFFPNPECSGSKVSNTISFKHIGYTPIGRYSTSLQHGFELLREMQCADPPRSVCCDGILIVNNTVDLNKSMRLEQYKNDASCNVFCGHIDTVTTESYMFEVRSNGCISSSNSGEIANYKATLCLDDTNCFGGCYNSISTGPNFIDLSIVYSSWERFAGSGNSTDIWEFVNGSMHSTINNQYPCHFISPEKYNKISCSITVRSGDEDDDSIYLVIAHVVVGGSPHTLSVIRTKGSNNQGGWGLPLLPTYFIALDFGIDESGTPLDQTIIASAVNIELGGIEGWSGDFSRLFVCRYEDIITIACSPFGSETVNENSQITINLDDDPRLSIFKGPQSVGFGCLSQDDSWFSSADFHPIGPPPPSTVAIPDIYDISEHTRWCWDSSQCSWEPIYVEFPCGGTPNPNTPCGAIKTPLVKYSRLVYDIRDKSIYEWDPIGCSWNKQQCPDWDIFEKNMIYFNDITCKIYFYDCDGRWNTLV